MRSIKKLLLGASALAVASAGMVFTTSPAQALPAGTAPNGSVTLPPSGALAANFNFAPDPAPAFCPGDSTTGYFWQGFIADAANDPATFVYDSNGPIPTGLTGFVAPLVSSTGTLLAALNTGAATADGGQIVGIPAINLGQYGGLLTPGTYDIGFACSLAGETVSFWTTQITVTATDWTQGGPQAEALAPTLDSAVGGDGEIVASWTPGGSSPADESYTVTAEPSNSGAGPAVSATVSAPTTSATLTGLLNGVEYEVSVVATNAIGDSPESNILTATPQASPPRNVVGAPGSSAGEALVTFDAPSSGTPLGYVVSITPADAPDVNVPAGGPLEAVFPGLTPGTQYTARVTAELGGGVTSFAESAPFTVNNAQVLLQEIEVTRPVGALILTQVCGVFGELPAFASVDAFPGYPRDLVLADAVAGPGTSPDITPDENDPQQDDDPQFGNYPIPFPATYPTECGLELGTAELVTDGALAGQYYTADGRLNQVTVVDTRDVDAGWTINGSVEDFDSGTDTFDGDYLGWEPVVTSDSDPAAAGGYDQIVTAGAPVLPGTGINSGSGLTSAQPLASAPVDSGLGIAELDARIQLLIPTEAPAGDYNATLSLTAV